MASTSQAPDMNDGSKSTASNADQRPTNGGEPSNIQPSPDFKVYRPPASSSSTPIQDLPESYFTPSAADLKVAQAQLSARTSALVDAPLQLRATRDAAENAKLNKYPTTTIRVKFSDRTQLEKTFPSTDKIKSVYAFVRGSLREDVKPIKFVLYQPPRRELKVSDLKVRDLTLAQLQLAPSSLLLLRFEDDRLNGSNVPAPLADAVAACAADLPKPPDPEVPTAPARTPSSSSPQTLSGSKLQSGEKKVPKWFKMGTKK